MFKERRLIFKKYTPSTDGNILDPFCDKYDLLNDKTQFLGFLKYLKAMYARLFHDIFIAVRIILDNLVYLYNLETFLSWRIQLIKTKSAKLLTCRMQV